MFSTNVTVPCIGIPHLQKFNATVIMLCISSQYLQEFKCQMCTLKHYDIAI